MPKQVLVGTPLLKRGAIKLSCEELHAFIRSSVKIPRLVALADRAMKMQKNATKAAAAASGAGPAGKCEAALAAARLPIRTERSLQAAWGKSDSSAGRELLIRAWSVRGRRTQCSRCSGSWSVPGTGEGSAS
uniref:Uncharacterized protein n=1 Tax=Alexandrium monilatum TaxID=311494 RepID=A0A7S4Q9K8_9DINO